MKTRIVVKEQKNGIKVFKPQFKKNFWNDWENVWVCDVNFDSKELENFNLDSISWHGIFGYQDSLELAKEIIDSFWIKHNISEAKKLEKKGEKTKKITYIKYP